MKINSHEVLLLNNSGKYVVGKKGNNFATSQIQYNSETSLNALDANAQNNIAFQRVSVQTLKKPVLKTMIALSLLAGGAALTQSCTKPGLTVNQSVTVDMTAFNQMFQQMVEYYKLMLEQQKITNEQFAENNAYLQKLLLEVQAGNMTMAEFKEAALRHFVTVETNQDTLIKLLEAQGKTQDEIKNLIEPFYDAYNKGDFETAWQYYLQIMNEINGHVANIDANLSQLLTDFNKFAKSFNEHKANTYAQLSQLNITNGLELDALKSIDNSVKSMKNDMADMKENSDKLIEMTEANHAEVIAYLKKIADGQVSGDDLELMLKTMGITITDAINMSKDELIAAIKAFQDTYIVVEEAQTQKLTEINNKLGALASFPGLGSTELQTLLTELKNAVNNNTSVLGGKLDNISGKLDDIIAKLDSMLDEMVDFHNDYNATSTVFTNKFNTTILGLDELKVAVEAFQLTQGQDNADLLAAIEGVKTKQNTSNTYLQLLLNKTDAGNQTLNEILSYARNGLTRAELEALLQTRDAANHTNYFTTLQAMLEGFGLDGLASDADAIIALLNSLNGKADGIASANNTLTDFLAKFEAFVGNKVYEKYDDAQLQAKMNEIKTAIENLRLICNCACNNNHEGTNQPGGGNLDDIFG